MRSKAILNNTITNSIVQIITLIVGLILPKLLLLNYGSEINGLRASITQIIGYLYIVEMGLAGALTYALYKPIQDNDINQINSILAAAKKCYKHIGKIFTGLLIIIAIVYPVFIKVESLNSITTVILIIAIGMTGTINYFLVGAYSVLLNADQKGYVLSTVRIIYLIINTTIMVSLIYLKLDIGIIYFISLISNLINAIIIRIYVQKKYTYIDLKVRPNESVFSKRTSVVLHQISGMVVFNVPVLILTIFRSLEEISIYSVYMIIFAGLNMIMGILSTAFTAAFGDLIAHGDEKKLQKAYSEYEYIYYITLTILYTCALILGISFVQIYTKGIQDANYIDPILILLFTIVGVMNHLKMPQTTIIIAAGHFEETRNRAIIEATITVITCLGFGIIWGNRGVVIGSIIGLAYRSIDIFYIRRIFGVDLKRTLLRIGRIFIISCLGVSPFLGYIKIQPDNFISWVIQAIAVGLWILSITIIINFVLENQTMKEILFRVKKLFCTKNSH